MFQLQFAFCNLHFAFCNFAFLCGLVLSLALAPSPAVAAETGKVVVPFDFVSKFDDGRYGEMLGDMFWKKLEREKHFVIPESMHDVRDICKNKNFHPAPDTPLEKMKKFVEEDFGGQVAIWGSVERAAGAEAEIYDLVIKCVDFSTPQPMVIYEKTVRTNSVSEIPHLYGKEMLDALYGRKPGGPPQADPDAEKRWKENPNLVVGGNFETAVRGVPKGWEPVAGQYREPLGNLVKWLAEVGNPKNHVIRFAFDRNIAENEGVMYYCEPFPVEAGAKYRFQCRWRSNGPSPKVFIKCYDETSSQYRAASEGKPAASPSTGKGGYVPQWSQMREVYRSQQNLKGEKNTWNTQTEDFTPKHTKYTPRWGRVMLYAYLQPGVVEFDDVVVKQIVPGVTSEQNQDPRHSIATKVTLREMEENERRSKAAKERAEREKAKKGK